MHYKRVLLKISGEALAGLNSAGKATGIDQDMLMKVASDIKNVVEAGIEVCLVVGGGNIYRGVSGSQSHGIDRATSDYMGMLATVINSMALQSAIEQLGLQSRVMTSIPMHAMGELYIRRRAIRHMEKGRVVIFAAGTGNPYFTTDTAAALRALEMDCDLLLKATKVDGVYDCDPHLHAHACFYETLTYQQVLEKQLAVMDATAIALIRENRLPIAVFSIFEENNFFKAVHGQGKFTLITE